MAMTVDGYIADQNDQTPWSDEEWLSFSRFVQDAGNIVVGTKTYEIMEAHGEFSKIGNPFTVVVSTSSFSPENNTVFVRSPQEALQILEEMNFSKALIAGGGRLNAAFMKEKLIDEIYLDVEPFIFGKGVSLFSDELLDVQLKLMESKRLSDNTIQLYYQVVK